MASAKKSKKVPQMGIVPKASEPRRNRESAAMLSSDAGRSKTGRTPSSGTPRIKLGSPVGVEPETSEMCVSVAVGHRADRMERANERDQAMPPMAPRGAMAQARGSTKVRRSAEASAVEAKRAETPSRASGRKTSAETSIRDAVSGESPRQARGKPIRSTTDAKVAPLSGPPAGGPDVANDSGSPPKIPETLDAPVNLAPISSDRKPVTKKDEKKAGADQASALASEQAVRLESAASSETPAVAGNSTKPAVRAPAAKATSLSEAVSAVKSAAKPSTSDQAAGELARAKPATQKPSERAAPTGMKPSKASSAARLGFKPQEFIVYPAHGVGQIVTIEEQEVAGFKLELFVISFIKDKMILKVPTSKAAMVGMRKLADTDVVKKAFDTLGGRARVKRTMWSRRAQEYEAKINSGDLVAIAEVVRDLFRSDTQPEQSYSERQLYEAALDRMTREIIVVQKLTETEALRAIEAQLLKGPRRGGKAEEIDPDEADIEEAA
jgi:CarD family transcriptional regulator